MSIEKSISRMISRNIHHLFSLILLFLTSCEAGFIYKKHTKNPSQIDVTFESRNPPQPEPFRDVEITDTVESKNSKNKKSSLAFHKRSSKKQ